MVETKCQRCDHSWDYTGKSENFCTCPSCSTSVKVGRGSESADGDSVEGNQQSGSEDSSGLDQRQVVLETGDIQEEMPLADAIQRVHESNLATGQAQEMQRRRVDRLERDVEEIEEAVSEVARILSDWMEREYPPEEHDWDGVKYESSLLQPSEGVSIPEALRTAEDAESDESGTYDPTEEFSG